jgi:small subunit ribosomal protein S2
MKKFIFGERKGIYIIDLQKTIRYFRYTYNVVRDAAAEGKTVLFVGTKKQAGATLREYAEKCGMPFVNHRWLGGMLTNYVTIEKRIARLKELNDLIESGKIESYPKKEAAKMRKESEKLNRALGGIKDMKGMPGAIFVIDPHKEAIAISEARKMGIPIVSVVDTNCDPDNIDFVIPGNDDAIRAVKLVTSLISDSVIEALEGKSFSEVSETREVEAAMNGDEDIDMETALNMKSDINEEDVGDEDEEDAEEDVQH